MSSAHDIGHLRQAIAEKSSEARALLFLWLSHEASDEHEFTEIAATLLGVSEQSLSRLVIHRGLTLFPESDSLSLLALTLEQESSSLAA
jgi:hypothetical protein